MTPVLELAADQRSRRIGTAKPAVEPQVEELPDDTGGSIDVGFGPPRPPGGRRWRGDPPPSWIRLLLYGAMLIAAFLVGWLIGKIWARIDMAAWGTVPLF
jgi:hypothetical protein